MPKIDYDVRPLDVPCPKYRCNAQPGQGCSINGAPVNIHGERLTFALGAIYGANKLAQQISAALATLDTSV